MHLLEDSAPCFNNHRGSLLQNGVKRPRIRGGTEQGCGWEVNEEEHEK